MAGDVPTRRVPHILATRWPGCGGSGCDADPRVVLAVACPFARAVDASVSIGIDHCVREAASRFDRPAPRRVHLVPARVCSPRPAGVAAIHAALIGDCSRRCLNAVTEARPSWGTPSWSRGRQLACTSAGTCNRRGTKVVVIERDAARRDLARLLRRHSRSSIPATNQRGLVAHRGRGTAAMPRAGLTALASAIAC